jgi:hypothetical protein
MKASQRHGVVRLSTRPRGRRRPGARAHGDVDAEGQVATERDTHRQKTVRELWGVIPVAPSNGPTGTCRSDG